MRCFQMFRNASSAINSISRRCYASKPKLVSQLEARIRKKANCAVYGFGLSASGALAIPSLVVNEKIVTSKEARKPHRIAFCNLRNIHKISSGFGFSLFASREAIYGSGLNNRYQIAGHLIGESTGQDYYISGKRIALPENPKILDISSGRAHSLISTSNGVYGIGCNANAQCGIDPQERESVVGRDENVLPKINIPSDSPIKKVHCTLDSSFVLTESGEIFAFGLNEDGQCANGSFGIQVEPTKIKGDADGEKIVSISGNTDTLIAISESGDIFVWGQNEYGQAGEGEKRIQLPYSRRLPLSIGHVVSASCTASTCLAVNSDGIVHVWGVGNLGLGPSLNRLTRPTAMDQPLFNDKKVSKVYGGNTCAAAVNSDGDLFVWGHNRWGQLGLDHARDQLFPMQVFLSESVKDVALGTDHTLVVVK